MRRVPRALVLGLIASGLIVGPALARGHGGGGHGGHHGGFHGGHGGFHHHGFAHGHAFFFGGAFVGPYPFPYYGYPYYYDAAGPYPVAPSPLYSAPMPGQCRVFQGEAVIAGTGQPFYGTACLQPDGAWHIVQ